MKNYIAITITGTDMEDLRVVNEKILRYTQHELHENCLRVLGVCVAEWVLPVESLLRLSNEKPMLASEQSNINLAYLTYARLQAIKVQGGNYAALLRIGITLEVAAALARLSESQLQSVATNAPTMVFALRSDIDGFRDLHHNVMPHAAVAMVAPHRSDRSVRH